MGSRSTSINDTGHDYKTAGFFTCMAGQDNILLRSVWRAQMCGAQVSSTRRTHVPDPSQPSILAFLFCWREWVHTLFFIYKGHPKIPSTHWPLFWPNFPVLMALKWPLFFFARTLIPLSSGKIREQIFLLNQTLIFPPPPGPYI